MSVVSPKQTAPADEIILPGNVQPFITSPIYARTNGYLKKWYFDIGAHVKQGQLLAVIETPEVDQQLQQARSNLLTAQANLELASITKTRYQGLLKSNAVSQQDVDNAVGTYNANKAIVEADKAAVEQYSALVSFEKIYAPFDGVITARNTDIGDLINSGSSSSVKTDLFHIAQPGKLRVYVNVPEEYSQGIKTGMTADLSLAEFPGRKFQGKLVRTADAINMTTRTLLIEIDVDNPTGTLLTGSYAEVHLAVPTQASTFLLPVNTLLFRSEGLRVGIVKDGKVVLTAVTPGHDFGNRDRDRLRPQAGRSGHCQPARLNRFRTGKSKLFRQHCREIPSETLSKDDFGSRIRGERLGWDRCSRSQCSSSLDARLDPSTILRWCRLLPPIKRWGTGSPPNPMTRILAVRGGRSFRIRSLMRWNTRSMYRNQNLKAAEAQFQQARAVLRYYRADYYPTVTAGPSATRTRISANGRLRVRSSMASPTTTLCCRSTFPTRPTSGDEFEKMWSLIENKRKPVRQTWLRSI